MGANRVGIASRTGFALLLFICAGCSVGPSFHRPNAEVPESWPSLANAVKPSPDQPPAETDLTQWWIQFKDPALDKLVADAIAGNLTLKQAELRILQARANRGIAASGFWPQVSENNQHQYSRTPTVDPTGKTFGAIRNFFQLGFDAAWEIDIFGGTRRGVEAATADIEASVEDRRDLLVTLVSEVGIDYIAYRSFQKELEIARTNLAAQQKSAELTNQRFRGGLVTALDVANAQALVATTKAQIPVLETAAQQTSYSLAILLGREPTALDAELKASAPIPPPPPAIPMGLPSELLRRRPDIRRAEAQIHAATARIGVAEADLFPKLQLTGGAGMQGARAPTLVHWANRFWNVGPTVNWQAFSGGRILSNIKLQKALEQASVLAYRQTVLTALQDVDNALVAYAGEKEHLQALAEAVRANQQAVDLSLKLYSDGKTDFLNVLSAQRSLYQAQDSLAQSERSLATNVVALYKALGGGWSEAEFAKPNDDTQQKEKVKPPEQ
ncbi:MAG TPA: efflux transporter outer membrane subunit [Planctomycetota bacterium]|jgi:NodT family efflux transporter outer membrane factor (OMF) lipoprotein